MKIISLTVVTLITASLYFVSLSLNHEQEAKFNKQQKKLDDIQAEVLSFNAYQGTDPKELIAKLAAAHQDIYKESIIETKEWVDNFEKQYQQKKAEHDAIVSNERELAQKLEIRWEPLYKFVVDYFDTTINEFRKNNRIKNYEDRGTAPLIRAKDNDPTAYEIRIVTFPNNRTLYIEVQPAIIKNGKLEKALYIYFATNREKELCSLIFTYDEIDLNMPFKNTVPTKKDPILDPEFKVTLTNDIHEMIESVYFDEPIVH